MHSRCGYSFLLIQPDLLIVQLWDLLETSTAFSWIPFPGFLHVATRTWVQGVQVDLVGVGSQDLQRVRICVQHLENATSAWAFWGTTATWHLVHPWSGNPAGKELKKHVLQMLSAFPGSSVQIPQKTATLKTNVIAVWERDLKFLMAF